MSVLCLGAVGVSLALLASRDARADTVADLTLQKEEAGYASARSRLFLVLLEQQHDVVRTAYGDATTATYRGGLNAEAERSTAELVGALELTNEAGEKLRSDGEAVRAEIDASASALTTGAPFDQSYRRFEDQLAVMRSCTPWENEPAHTREILRGICELTADAHKTGDLVHHFMVLTGGAEFDTPDAEHVNITLAGLLPQPSAIDDRLGGTRTFKGGRESDLRFKLGNLDREAMDANLERIASTDTSPLTTAGRYVQTSDRRRNQAAGASFEQISSAYLRHLDDLEDIRVATITDVKRDIDDELAAAERRSSLDVGAAVAIPLTVFPLLAVFEFRRRRQSRRFIRYFMTDSLTGLPNRYFLEKHMPSVLSGRQRTDCAFMQVDIDRLKAVNETYGHAVGDQLLVEVGHICTAAAGAPGRVVRLTADEFLVALHSLPDPLADANRIAERIQKALAEPLRIGDLHIKVKVSIGIAMSRRPTTVDGLLLEAGSALLEAKATGRGQTVEYGNTNRSFIVRRLPIAFQQREIRCELQPQIDLRTGDIPAVEVLARWYPTDGPRIAIPELIRTIESLGGTERLLRAMSGEAAAAARELGDTFTGRFFLNVSPLDLLPFDAADRILEVLLSGGLPPERIGIEITETEQIGDLEHAANVLSELRQHNIAIAIDDFGVGNTPLIHLTDLPIDEVKLDRSVVSGIDGDRRNRSVVSAMTQVAETLSLSVVAEGIESASELDELRALGVQFGQGYLFAKPMPVADLGAFLIEWHEGGRSAEILG